MRFFVILLTLSLCAPLLRADTPLFDPARHMRISEVKPGMKGYGLSVFSGTKIEKFDVEVVSVLKEMKSAGKAVVGMKILGQGALRNRQDEGIKYALSLGLLDAFTIGAESKQEQEDLIRRVAAA